MKPSRYALVGDTISGMSELVGHRICSFDASGGALGRLRVTEPYSIGTPMGTHTEASGRQTPEPLEVRGFIKAFIAALVTRDFVELRPHEPATRRGFGAVVDELDREADRLYGTGGGNAAARRLTRLSNALRASNTGAYDGFESALRQVQLTFTSSPNPDYDEIAFSVPKLYASAVIAQLEEF